MTNRTKIYLILITGFLFTALALLLFSPFIISLDSAVTDWAIDTRNSQADTFWNLITFLGSWQTAVLFFIASLAVALRMQNAVLRSNLLTVVISSIVYIALVFFIKELTGKQRPPVMTQLVTENTFSFPSGHVASIVASMITLHGFFVLLRPKFSHFFLLLVSTVLIGLVAFSRIYLGVHWLSDTIGSVILGIGWYYVTDLVMVAWNNQTESIE